MSTMLEPTTRVMVRDVNGNTLGDYEVDGDWIGVNLRESDTGTILVTVELREDEDDEEDDEEPTTEPFDQEPVNVDYNPHKPWPIEPLCCSYHYPVIPVRVP